jgi:hypothetical protein
MGRKGTPMNCRKQGKGGKKNMKKKLVNNKGREGNEWKKSRHKEQG